MAKKKTSKKNTKNKPEIKPDVIKITPAQRDLLFGNIFKSNLDKETSMIVNEMIKGNAWLMEMLEKAQTTIHKLRKMFGIKTEKLPNRKPPLNSDNPSEQNKGDTSEINSDTDGKNKSKGHGRNSADAYTGANIVNVDNMLLSPGDTCPEEYCDGRLYESSDPGVVIRITGGKLAESTRYNLQKLRCATCETIFTANLPNGVSSKKYDESFISMLMINRYFMSMPMYRQDKLQSYLGVPLPSSTQWDLMNAQRPMLEALYGALRIEAANGVGICFDDTPAKILDMIRKKKKNKNLEKIDSSEAKEKKVQYTCYTTGMVSIHKEHFVYLYQTDNLTAGKCMQNILRIRNKKLPAPCIMCDALTANIPKEISEDLYILCYCLVHARRQFYELPNGYDDLADKVIMLISHIYDNEATAKLLDPDKRLEYHSEHSVKIMAELKIFLETERLNFEPNSIAGKAINYMLKRWTEMSQFLRHKDAPIDNNITERALKLVIQTRKSSMFYKSLKSAELAGYIQSALYTAAQNDVNPCDYMIALLKNSAEVIADPKKWLPWVYKKKLQAEAGSSRQEEVKCVETP